MSFHHRLFGPSEAEIRAAWVHLTDDELRRMIALAKAEGENSTARILTEEWVKRCFERPLVVEVEHLAPGRIAA